MSFGGQDLVHIMGQYCWAMPGVSFPALSTVQLLIESAWQPEASSQSYLGVGLVLGDGVGFVVGVAIGPFVGFTDGLMDGLDEGKGVDGDPEGLRLGELDGCLEGLLEGPADGLKEGCEEGSGVGLVLGFLLGWIVGEVLGDREGDNVGFSDGDVVGEWLGPQWDSVLPALQSSVVYLNTSRCDNNWYALYPFALLAKAVERSPLITVLLTSRRFLYAISSESPPKKGISSEPS